MSAARGLFQKERIVFQPSFLRGDVFSGEFPLFLGISPDSTCDVPPFFGEKKDLFALFS